MTRRDLKESIDRELSLASRLEEETECSGANQKRYNDLSREVQDIKIEGSAE